MTLKDVASTHQLRFAIFRYFNACGADPGGKLTERHDPETHLIPLAIDAAARKGQHGRFSAIIIRPQTARASETSYMYQTWRRPTSRQLIISTRTQPRSSLILG